MVDEMRQALEAARATWGERGEVRIDSGLAYGDGDPVRGLRRLSGYARTQT